MKKDKILHLTIAFFITFIGLACLYFAFNYWQRPNLAYLITNIVMISLIIGKEGWDCIKKKPTGFSLADFMFGFLGMVVADIIFYVVIMIYWNIK